MDVAFLFPICWLHYRFYCHVSHFTLLLHIAKVCFRCSSLNWKWWENWGANVWMTFVWADLPEDFLWQYWFSRLFLSMTFTQKIAYIMLGIMFRRMWTFNKPDCLQFTFHFCSLSIWARQTLPLETTKAYRLLEMPLKLSYWLLSLAWKCFRLDGCRRFIVVFPLQPFHLPIQRSHFLVRFCFYFHINSICLSINIVH